MRDDPATGPSAARRALPRTPSVFVEKAPLVAMLNRREPLAVVRAPRGYGKTSFLSRWARTLPDTVDVVWVACRPPVSATGEVPLWDRVAEELRACGVLADGPGPHGAYTDVVEHLTRSRRELCLVLDDYGRADVAGSGDELVDLVRRFDRLEIVVSTSDRGPVESVLAATIDSVVVRPADLLLTAEETARLVADLGYTLTLDGVEALHLETAGWPALVRAILANGVPPGLPPGPVSVDDIDLTAGGPFLQSVWDDLADRRLATFIQRTGILDEFTLEEARWCTGTDEPLPFVQTMLETGLLVRDNRAGVAVYRYVPVVRRACAAQLQALAPDTFRSASRRVAAIFAADEKTELALRHLRRAGLWEECATLVDSRWVDLVAQSPEAVAAVVDEMPSETLERHPRLVIARDHLLPAIRELAQDVADDLPPVHGPAAVALGRGGGPGPGPGPRDGSGAQPAEVFALPDVLEAMEQSLAQIASLRLTGDFGAAKGVADRSHADVLGRVDELQNGIRGDLAPVLYEWAVTRLLAADLPGALSAFREAVELAGPHGHAEVYRDAAVGAALCCALLGFVGPAEAWLDEAQAEAGRGGVAAGGAETDETPPDGAAERPGEAAAEHPDEAAAEHPDEAAAERVRDGAGDGPGEEPARFLSPRTVRRIVAIERLEDADAAAPLPLGGAGPERGELWSLEVLLRAQSALTDGRHFQVLAEIERARAQVPLPRERNLREALLVCAAVDLHLSRGHVSRAREAIETVVPRYEVTAIAQARIASLSGDLDEAVAIGRQWLGGRLDGPRHRLDLLLVVAAAEFARGRLYEAAGALEEAVGIAAATGLLRSFLAVPHATLDALAAEVPGVRAVLDAPGFRSAAELFPAPTSTARLSSRETEVLEALAASTSLAGVARSLYLSSNTVKTHLRSIYRKLGTHSSIETVERARELGLLRREP